VKISIVDTGRSLLNDSMFWLTVVICALVIIGWANRRRL